MSDQFNPTEGQAAALAAIKGMKEKFPGGGGVCVISGYAGTGKTTLLKVLAKESPTLFVLTPTGKAAVRVKQAAGCEAMTIHLWMYKPRKDEKTGEYKFDQKASDELRLPPNGTLIIDEASMIPAKVWEHLYFYCQALGLNIVLIGDGFQLPPVEIDPEKKAFSIFSDSFKADVRVNLMEVLRQALESPIIRISTLIRTEADITGPLTQLDIVTEKRLDEALMEMHDQKGVILCHRNATRHTTNARIRSLKKLPEDQLQSGEPLLVTRNNYQLNVFNGEVFTLSSIQRTHGPLPVTDRYKNKSMFMTFREVAFSDNPNRAAVCDEEVFGKAGDIDPDAIFKSSRFTLKKAYRDEYNDDEQAPVHMHANLGYALTCHKSQGSEWPEAVVMIESSVRVGTTEGRRWLYTALTRARNRVRVCWL